MRKIELKRKLFLLIASAVAALLSSSYTEGRQQNFFAGLKNLVLIGQSSVYEEVDGIRLKNHFGQFELNPVGIAQQVLQYSENELIRHSKVSVTPYAWRSDSQTNVQRVADFIKNNYEPVRINDVDVLLLPYQFDYPFYSLSAPWYSGMAQGHAIIVMLHAYQLTENKDYLDSARMLYNALTIPIVDGGVLVEQTPTENSLTVIVFEEYADPARSGFPQPKVLNGNIFAIDGLFWFWYFTADPKAERLLKQAILSVERLIPEYDALAWSYYDLMSNYANYKYHQIHIYQLKRLQEYAAILGFEELPNVSKIKNRWKLYNYVPFAGYLERMLLNRNRMLYVIYISNLMAFLMLFFLALILFPLSRPMSGLK
jgi:hypothetical protein